MPAPSFEVTCPSCGKLNAASPCQRCGGDLSPLFQILQAARSNLIGAATELKRGDGETATVLAERAWTLHRSEEAAGMALLGCIASGNDQGTRTWLARYRASAD